MELVKEEEKRKDSDAVYALSAKIKAHEDNAQFIWYKAAFKVREVMTMMIEKAGGFEKFNEVCFLNKGRLVPVDSELAELLEYEDEWHIGGGKVTGGAEEIL